MHELRDEGQTPPVTRPVRSTQMWERTEAANRMYPVVLELEYQVCAFGVGDKDEVCRPGSGRTLSISSDSVLFESDRALRAGLSVDLFIAWPALLNDSVSLTLRIWGLIVTTSQNRARLTTMRHEFRAGPRN